MPGNFFKRPISHPITSVKFSKSIFPNFCREIKIESINMEKFHDT